MNRRTFVKTSLLGLGAYHSLNGRSFSSLLAPTHYDLAIVKGVGIAQNITAAIEALGGIGRFVKTGDIVMLKPNMSFPNPPEWGSTTHPDVIRTVAKLCIQAGAKRVIAVEFPMRAASLCFERSGMTSLLESMKDISFVELKDESHFELKEVPGGDQFQKIHVAKIVGKADVFINLPTAKSHSGTDVSFGMKNLMGLIWERKAFHRDYDLQKSVADLATVIRPHLTILDATFALLTNGPQGPGKTEQLDTIVAGIDPVAVDAFGCGLAEWNNRSTSGSRVTHIARAAEKGVGTLDPPSELIFRTQL